MISVIFTILKIIGIVFLAVLILALTLLLLVLFVPVRYEGYVVQKPGEEQAKGLRARFSAFWLLHIVNMAFAYPDAAYIRLRILGFTVYSSRGKGGQGKKHAAPQADARSGKDSDQKKKEETSARPEGQIDAPSENSRLSWDALKEDQAEETDFKKEEDRRFRDFLKGLFDKLVNIKYTILQICDKIKHMIENIGYYVAVIKSEAFGRAWGVCSGEVISLLKKILPGKIKGRLLIGTGEPASTGQVLAVYGILYPLIGESILLEPDFENKILEGELLLKGKITVVKALKTAFVLYRNRDLRRVIKLLKREAA